MKESLSNGRIVGLLANYGVSASETLAESIRAYISLLLRWNAKISLTTVVDPIEILKFHFGESLFAAAKVQIFDGRLADVGSGAGFPGLPLAMLSPNLEVVLIESNLKKAAFLSEVLRELKIENAAVWRGRVEDLKDKEAFDFVTARALGIHGEFLKWSRAALNLNGNVILWLGERDAKQISASPEWTWRGQIEIPDSIQRVLLIGSPKRSA